MTNSTYSQLYETGTDTLEENDVCIFSQSLRDKEPPFNVPNDKPLNAYFSGIDHCLETYRKMVYNSKYLV